MMEIDGNLSRLQSAMIVEKFNWNRKKCFDKMFFWFLLLTFVMWVFPQALPTRLRQPVNQNKQQFLKISKSNLKCLAPFSIPIKFLKNCGTLNTRWIAINFWHFFEKNIILKQFITHTCGVYDNVGYQKVGLRSVSLKFQIVRFGCPKSQIYHQISSSFSQILPPNLEKVGYGIGQIVFDSKKSDSEALEIVGFGSDSRISTHLLILGNFSVWEISTYKKLVLQITVESL